MTCEKTDKRPCPLRRKIAGLRTRVEKLDIRVRLYRDRLKKIEGAVDVLRGRMAKYDATNEGLDRYLDKKIAEDGVAKIVKEI